MPELPEVETVSRGLARALTGTTIKEAEVKRRDLRIPFPKNLVPRLKGRHIVSIKRRAKYILITLDKAETLILHLGMSGRMIMTTKPQKPGKHDHFVFHCTNGVTVTFNDPRRFGLCDLVPTPVLSSYKLFKHLGVEPLGSEFNTNYLSEKLQHKKTSIKVAIMDQRVVVGVGNIYASEALYGAGIRPTRRACSIKTKDIEKLIESIQKTLKAAIKAGGSSLRDYVQADGELGYFQKQFAVYDREGLSCPNCMCDIATTGGIRRITQGGRSTFYCRTKQV